MTTATLPRTDKLLLTGREYLRVSKDRSGRLRSVSEQTADNHKAADRYGITLREPYAEDHAVGASRHSVGDREAFSALVGDLENDRFGADVLIMWETSRGSRKVSEWARLIEICEERNVKIMATAGGGKMYDPSDARDRRSLHEDATDAEYEAAKTSQRTRRAAAANAAEGRPHGQAPYGFTAVHDPRTGRLATWEHDPDRAPIIRELFERLRKGHSFKSITKDFAERGITNKRGGPFSHQHLRDLAQKASYAGLRTYKGELIEGTWDAIVDRALYWDVQRILSEPAHQSSAPRPGRALHEFTGIMRCDVCGGPIGTVGTRGRPEYKCQKNGCLRIEKTGVDEIVLGVILDYLARRDVYEGLTARSDSVELAAVTAELAKLRAELAEAENAKPASLTEARMFAKVVDEVKVKVTGAETRIRELATPSELAHLVQPGGDVAKRWEDAPISARRKAAAILLTPEILGQVRITRSPVRNHRVDAGERIVWRRQESSTTGQEDRE